MFRLLVMLLAAPLAAALPVSVLIEGNFGPPSGTPTVFDNQAYSVQFIIGDPSLPTSALADPGIGFARVDYMAGALLTVPGLGLAVPLSSPNTVEYILSGGGTWLNLFQFSPVPGGDFLLATPVRTLSGAALWNGQMPLSTAIGLFNHEPASAMWRLQQVPGPGQPSIPLATYAEGSATITVSAVPEPTTFWITLVALGLVIGIRFLSEHFIRHHGLTQRKPTVVGRHARV